MKIKTLYFKDVGPLKEQKIDLTDSWTDDIARLILFSGPNGTGKSIILRMIAMLWDAAGYWLDQRKNMPKSEPAYSWLNKWGGCAVVFNEIFNGSGPVGLVFGDSKWFERILEKPSRVTWIGETIHYTGKPGRPSHKFMDTFDEHGIANWAELRKKLILTFDDAGAPNLVYLDAEERRWIPPKRGVGKPAPEDSKLRWLVRYKVTEDWQGQLEASLITLKTSKLHSFHETVRMLNKFLYDKEIEPEIRTGENRLRVKLKDSRGQFHFLDDLSAGEHQILIQLYLLHRWLEPAGIILIDEPDLHLHPSLIPGFLASLESLVEKKKGQLLITSHLPDLWNRYESIGRRISLGGEL
jgi:predicted ATPase